MPMDSNQVPKLNGLSMSEDDFSNRIKLKKSMEISDENFTYMSMDSGPESAKVNTDNNNIYVF